MNFDFEQSIRMPFAQRDSLPSKSGVYVARHGNDVLYIGMAQDIRARWKRHKKIAELSGLAADVELCCFLMPIEEAAQVEAAWIEQVQPPLNIVGVPGKPRNRREKQIVRSQPAAPTGPFTPLWERPDFIPCGVGDELTAAQVAAVLPGIDGLVREVARGVASQHSTGGTSTQEAG